MFTKKNLLYSIIAHLNIHKILFKKIRQEILQRKGKVTSGTCSTKSTLWNG